MTNEMRIYDCEHYIAYVPETSCFFCDHCTDILFDYTHGPYAFVCDIDKDVEIGLSGKCDSHIEGTEGR